MDPGLARRLVRLYPASWRARYGELDPAAIRRLRRHLRAAAAMLVLSIQLWVSLRWKSFIAGLALVMVAVMVMLGGIARTGSRAAFARFYPWAMPVSAIARMLEPAPERTPIAADGLVGGLLVAIAGCWELSRREF
jgi:hypothetical protein